MRCVVATSRCPSSSARAPDDGDAAKLLAVRDANALKEPQNDENTRGMGSPAPWESSLRVGLSASFWDVAPRGRQMTWPTIPAICARHLLACRPRFVRLISVGRKLARSPSPSCVSPARSRRCSGAAAELGTGTFP